MAWVAVDKDGAEFIFNAKPVRVEDVGLFSNQINNSIWGEDYVNIRLPNGTIANMLGYALYWNDEPVELK